MAPRDSERDAVVAGAGEHDRGAERLELPLRLLGDGEVHGLLQRAGRAHRARLLAAVAGVEHDVGAGDRRAADRRLAAAGRSGDERCRRRSSRSTASTTPVGVTTAPGGPPVERRPARRRVGRRGRSAPSWSWSVGRASWSAVGSTAVGSRSSRRAAHADDHAARPPATRATASSTRSLVRHAGHDAMRRAASGRARRRLRGP